MRHHAGWGLAIALLLSAADVAVAAPGSVKPIVTNKLRFRIPFRFDAAVLQRMNARELQLFASNNRGASWGLAQSITPQSGRFEYQATGDGEYWFAVRTIDGFGQAHPAGEQLDPGLIVMVDTAAPILELQVQAVGPGKVQLSWQSTDPNLDPASLRLEYLQPGSTEWQPVSVVPRNHGLTTWSVPQGGQVAVRGSISDLAGNQGLKQTQTTVAAGDPNARPAGPEIRQPIAEAPSAPMAALPRGPVISPGAPSDGRTPIPQPPLGTAPRFISGDATARPDIMQDRWTIPDPIAVEPNPTFRPQSQGRQRIINTRRFTLGYRVDDVGPSGVGGVDLFITQDQGRKWFRYGEDADRKSPFEVEVPQDGEYGFEVRVRSGAGLSMDPPQPGEPPSIQVLIDQTPPTLELMPMQQGQGTAMNQVLIRWRTTDTHPSDKPISLYYAPSPQGPWELISGWRPDTGTFPWTVAAGSPMQLYVRVMARDAAGNIAQAETTQPVVVDLTRPTARIVDVEVQPLPSPQ
jgi:hypothetical protein